MITLLACPQMQFLADALLSREPAFRSCSIHWDRFKDGFPNLKVENVDAVRNHEVAFLASFDTPGEIFRQLSAIYEIPRYGVKSFKLVLPYYPTGTMERVDEDGQIATAATLAKMLSQIPSTMSGPAQIIIYDIHALQERFYFSDQVMPRLETALPLLRERLLEISDLAVAFPDDGARKRFARHFDNTPLIVCQKVRTGDTRRLTLKEGDPRGKHVVIVDDLVMSGGTLLKCQALLREYGAAKVSAYVTHGVFPERSEERFSPEAFDRFWLTDSCPIALNRIQNRPPFEVLSLAAPIAELIKNGR